MTKKILVFICFIMILPLIFACGNATDTSSAESNVSTSKEESSVTGQSMQELLDADNNSVKTELPEIVVAETVSDGRGVISGYCEEGAEIFFEWEGMVVGTAISSEGVFMAELNFKTDESPYRVNVYAKAENKGFSEPTQKRLFFKTNIDELAQDIVRFGTNGWLFFTNTEPQYTNNEKLNDKIISSITNRAKNKVDWLKNNKDAKLIYLLAPNPNDIYSEYMPSTIVKGDQSLMTQVGAALSEGGATVIDLRDIMMAHKNDDFDLYHKTDSHWTEYAGYFAYKELFDVIAKDFPAAAPRPIDDFEFVRVERDAGDLYYDLGLSVSDLQIKTTFANEKFDTGVDIEKYLSPTASRINERTMELMEFSSGDESKPNLFIMRDSYSVMMFDWIAERSNNVTFMPLWEFGFNTDELEKHDVDYVIYILCEMNIMSILR